MATVDVIIPAFNAATYLPAALESVATQTFEDWQIVLVDDGSTDDTAAIVQPFLQRFGTRLKYMKQENRGLPAARTPPSRHPPPTSSHYSMPTANPCKPSWEMPPRLKVVSPHASTCARSSCPVPPSPFAGRASMKSRSSTRPCAPRKIATYGFGSHCDMKLPLSPKCSPTTGSLPIPCRPTRSECWKRNCSSSGNTTAARAAVSSHDRLRGLERISSALRPLPSNASLGIP
jgi:hypothetical protein